MFKNHLQLAIRNLFKRKGYSLLNIFGLAIGITCCLLIFQHVAYERSYERFNSNAGQVVRLRLDAWQQGRLAWQSATVYPAIAPAMKKEFPEVADYCRLIDAASGEELVRFDLTNAEAQTGVMMAKLIKQFSGEWEMTAMGAFIKSRTVRGMVKPAAEAL